MPGVAEEAAREVARDVEVTLEVALGVARGVCLGDYPGGCQAARKIARGFPGGCRVVAQEVIYKIEGIKTLKVSQINLPLVLRECIFELNDPFLKKNITF